MASSSGIVGEGRVVQIDFQEVSHKFVSKRVFHLGLIALQIGEEVIAHRQSATLLENHSSVLKTNLGPRIDCEASIFLTGFVVPGDEIRFRFRL